jgi:DNA-binding response OmpR family regulator
MREGGNRTPVIMLTSESKRTVVAGAMKQGITDYILKPFKPEELRAKVLSVLQGEPGGAEIVAAAGGGAPAARATPEPEPAPAASGASRFVDVLVVDDMDNVHKKLRSMLPPHVSLNAFASAQQALGACREKVYRVVLVDTEIPDVNSAVLAQQLRVLQPHAAVVALALRTANDVTKETKEQGFDDVLFKPFRPENVDDFLLRYFDNQDFLVVEDNVLKVAAFTGRADRVDRFYARLNAVYTEALEKIAAACHDEAILDVGQPPLEGDKLPKFVNAVAGRSKEFGIQLTLVGAPEVRKVLSGYEETKDIRICATLAEARSGAAA